MSANIDVRSIMIDGNDCPITDPLKLTIKFSSDKVIKNAHWEIKYVVDYANKRHVVEVGKVEGVNIKKGVKHEFKFAVDALDIGTMKKSVLLNMGLLLCTLKNRDKEIIQISMVTQVTKDDKGNIMRTIFSPLG